MNPVSSIWQSTSASVSQSRTTPPPLVCRSVFAADLAGRYHEVGAPRRRQTRPGRRQPRPVREPAAGRRRRPARARSAGASSGFARLSGQAAGPQVVRRWHAHVARRWQRRMRPARVGEHRRGQLGSVIRAQRADLRASEGMVEQALVPARLSRSSAPDRSGPDRLAQIPHPPAGEAVSESAQCRNQPGRITAQFPHISNCHTRSARQPSRRQLSAGTTTNTGSLAGEPRRTNSLMPPRYSCGHGTARPRGGIRLRRSLVHHCQPPRVASHLPFQAT